MRCNLFLNMTLAMAAACGASTQAERARDASNAQIDKRTVAQTKAIEDHEDQRIAAIERRHEIAREKVAVSGMSNQLAAKRAIKTHEQRSTYAAKAKARIDTIGVRIDAAQNKLAVLGGRAPMALRGELSAVRDQYAQLQPAVDTLSATPAVDWESAAEQLDVRLSALNARVKRLTSAIEAQAV